MALPNFLIIGDAKAGTTSLYHYLKQHPDVFMPTLKELRYFAYDGENPYHVRARSYRVRTFSEYLGHFEKCGTAKAIGEASPNYLRGPAAAARIKAEIPGARLIASLRNPADRLHSAYMMEYRAGRTKKPFDEQLFGHDAAWIKSQFCWLELKRYFDLFAPSQIKIVLFDDLKADPRRVVQELCRFLDIDDAFAPDLAPKNEGGLPRNQLWYAMLKRGKGLLRPFGAPPPAVKHLLKRVERGSLQKPQLDPQLRRKILEMCEDDIRRTQELIGRDLSGWLRKDGPISSPSAIAPAGAGRSA
jgi:hypothetical protein